MSSIRHAGSTKRKRSPDTPQSDEDYVPDLETMHRRPPAQRLKRGAHARTEDAALESQNAALKAQVAALENQVAALQAQVAALTGARTPRCARGARTE